MVHPDRVVDEAGFANLPLIDPVYPLTEGLHPNQLRKAIDLALERLPKLPEWQDGAWLQRNAFPGFADALRSIHRPATPDDLMPDSAAWSRLAYDELLAGQLALALLRAHLRKRAGRGSAAEGLLRARIVGALPYTLTPSQQRAVEDIVADLAQPHRMLRLLHGDVGSGKTVVALYALLRAVESGRLGALMAPTETLAEQHFLTIEGVCAELGVSVVLLTGSAGSAKARAAIESGEAEIAVGTHALIELERQKELVQYTGLIRGVKPANCSEDSGRLCSGTASQAAKNRSHNFPTPGCLCAFSTPPLAHSNTSMMEPSDASAMTVSRSVARPSLRR
jgi:ATP-dependent DNA helicase RecG